MKTIRPMQLIRLIAILLFAVVVAVQSRQRPPRVYPAAREILHGSNLFALPDGEQAKHKIDALDYPAMSLEEKFANVTNQIAIVTSNIQWQVACDATIRGVADTHIQGARKGMHLQETGAELASDAKLRLYRDQIRWLVPELDRLQKAGAH